MKVVCMLLLFACPCIGIAQNVGIGTTAPNSSAMLDINSINKGLLAPRLTLAQRNAIANPAKGLMIYQTSGTEGLYINTGTPASPNWTMAGNISSTGTASYLARFATPTLLENSNIIDSSIGLLYNRTFHNNPDVLLSLRMKNAGFGRSWASIEGGRASQTYLIINDSVSSYKGFIFSSSQQVADYFPNVDSSALFILNDDSHTLEVDNVLGTRLFQFHIPTKKMGNTIGNAHFSIVSPYDTAGYYTSSSLNYLPNGILRSEYTGSTVNDHVAIYGKSVPTMSDYYGIGVTGEGGYKGVAGMAVQSGINASIGVDGRANTNGDAYGVFGQASLYSAGGGTKYGIYGTAAGGATNYAGYFSGNVQINGTYTTTGTKSFKIDYPLDPENKYLYHYSIESDEVLNVYSGNITTGATGYATVQLPEYFETLNKDFRYQLTVVGTFAQAIVKEKIAGNRFTIQTSQPNVEVSWVVYAVRNDKYMIAHPSKTVVPKEAENVGKYLQPAEWNQPEEKGIDYKSNHPGLNKPKPNNVWKPQLLPKDVKTPAGVSRY